MIWIGRLLSIPLGLLLLVVLLFTLILLQVNGTFLDPNYYTEELAEADIYEFALNDLLTVALDEAREIDVEGFTLDAASHVSLDENPLVTSGLTTEQIVASVNRAVPPEWVQGQVEQVFDQFGRYLSGERDTFAVTVRGGDQVVVLVDEVKTLLREAEAYELLFELVVEPLVEEAVEFELPLGVDVSSERLMQAARRIVHPDWVREQVEAILDEATPYVVGERDTFEINVQLAERVDIALDEIKSILRETDTNELLYGEEDGIIKTAIEDFLDDVIDLPMGVTITREEVVASLRRVSPADWIQEQAERLIDDVGPYLTGRQDSFETEVDLRDNKREAADIIVEIVSKQVNGLVEEIPRCSATDVIQSVTALELPKCIPEGTNVGDFIGGLDIAGPVQELVLAPIPNTIKFTDRQLRTALKQAAALDLQVADTLGDNLELVDQVREILRDGWTYTEEDLRRGLRDLEDELTDDSLDLVGLLDDVRGFLADGWTYREGDFRDHLAAGAGRAAVSDVDTGRDILGTARTYKWIIYLPFVLLLVTIGFLGGRGWTGRVAWGSGVLMVTAGIVFLIFGPAYDIFAKSGPNYVALDVPPVEEARLDLLADIARSVEDFPETARLAANKGFDIAESIIDGFASGIAASALTLATIGLVAMLIAIFWSELLQLVEGVRSRR